MNSQAEEHTHRILVFWKRILTFLKTEKQDLNIKNSLLWYAVLSSPVKVNTMGISQMT
jgi:hypothetical protein